MRIRSEQPGFAQHVQQQYRAQVEQLYTAAQHYGGELQILETPECIRTIERSGILPMRELRRQYAERLRQDALAVETVRQELDAL